MYTQQLNDRDLVQATVLGGSNPFYRFIFASWILKQLITGEPVLNIDNQMFIYLSFAFITY